MDVLGRDLGVVSLSSLQKAYQQHLLVPAAEQEAPFREAAEVDQEFVAEMANLQAQASLSAQPMHLGLAQGVLRMALLHRHRAWP